MSFTSTGLIETDDWTAQAAKTRAELPFRSTCVNLSFKTSGRRGDAAWMTS
jgi:hypothetical protein